MIMGRGLRWTEEQYLAYLNMQKRLENENPFEEDISDEDDKDIEEDKKESNGDKRKINKDYSDCSGGEYYISFMNRAKKKKEE